MTGPSSYNMWDPSSRPYPPPPSSASATSQSAYVESFPAYDYSSTSTPSLPEYHQGSPRYRFAHSAYHPSSSHFSSHPSSRHSVSSSEADEQTSSHARAPVHSMYAGPRVGQSAMSPAPMYDHPPEHTPRMTDSQQRYSPTSDYYSVPVTRASSRVDRQPQSMFARAPVPPPLPHHGADGGAYASTDSHIPPSVVGSSDGWTEGAPLELPPPPKGSAAAASRRKPPAQAPRKRVPASCTPCRKKKLRCNRSMPCSSCVERGDPDGCTWDGDAVPLFVAREETDVKELKAQVDRLQHLLDALSDSTPPKVVGIPTSNRASVTGSSSQQSLNKYAEQPSFDTTTFDLHAQDLCGALAELALEGVSSTQQAGAEAFAPGGTSGEVFLDDAERFLVSFTQQAGLLADPESAILTPISAAPSPPSPPKAGSLLGRSASALSSVFFPARPTMRQVLPLLPSDKEMRSTYDFYLSSTHCCFSPISPESFEQRWSAFRETMGRSDESQRERELDPLVVATLLGAWASGLASMTNQQAQACGFPQNRTAVVDSWIRAGMLSLAAGKFMEEPTLDGIRAAVIIASLYIDQTAMTGESITAGLSLLSLAVHATFALSLHRDPGRPSKNPRTFAECEERRRLFWSVFSLCMSVTTGMSRAWTQFDLRQIDCKFPLDCHDAELEMDERAIKARVRGRRSAEAFEETPMTAPLLRAQHGLLVKKITDKAFGIVPCSYDDVLALDADLVAFEQSLPPTYELPIDGANRVHLADPPSVTDMRAAVVQLYLASEFVRLHRPFLILATTDDSYQYSREQCVKYAKRLLALSAAPGCGLNCASHKLMAVSAAITLAIELLQSPTEPDAPIVRSAINFALEQAEYFAGSSSVCRKGAGVVRFLLCKVDNQAANDSAPRRAKRARTLRYSPEGNKPQRLSLARALGGAPSAASSRASSPDDRSRRHKPTRPPLVHVASDTVVPRTLATPTIRMAQAPVLRLSRSRSADQAFPTVTALNVVVPSGAQSAEAAYAPIYTVAPPARQIAGLGSASPRRTREMSDAALGANVTLAASATFSPPSSALHLHLPSSPFRDTHNGPSTASTTGGFDFGELSLGGTRASRSNDSLLGDGEMQDLFALSTTGYSESPVHQGKLLPEEGYSPEQYKFHVPKAEEDFAYLN